MNELQQNRYDRLVRRVGGIIGTGSKVSEVLTELFPMLDVETDRGELQLLSGTRLGMGPRSLLSAAGQSAKIQLFNPVDSAVLVTITSIYVTSSQNSFIHVGRGTILLADGIGTELPRDTRLTVNQRMTARMLSESSSGFSDANMIFSVFANRVLKISDPNGVMVLSPGNGCTVNHSSTNQILTVTFLWRERPAESSELNF